MKVKRDEHERRRLREQLRQIEMRYQLRQMAEAKSCTKIQRITRGFLFRRYELGLGRGFWVEQGSGCG